MLTFREISWMRYIDTPYEKSSYISSDLISVMYKKLIWLTHDHNTYCNNYKTQLNFKVCLKRLSKLKNRIAWPNLGLFQMNCDSALCLTLSWRRSFSYRNQSIDLLAKSMDWFLYDKSLRHERFRWNSNNRTMNLPEHQFCFICKSQIFSLISFLILHSN